MTGADGTGAAEASTPMRPGDASPVASDRWTRWARPGVLWVAYALLLWAVPVGLVAAIDPARAGAMAAAMSAYWKGIPESLYALMGTGFLGYAAARSVEKVTR